MRPIAQTSTGPTTKLVAVYYVLTVALGLFVLSFHGRLAPTVDLAAGVFYVALTVLFYESSKRAAHARRPKSRN